VAWGRVARALAVGVLISIAVTAVSRSGALAGWETRAVDAFLFLRDRQPAPEIVVVAIDDDAFRELGQRQPLPRRHLAELADFLLRGGARVVGFDLALGAATAPAEDAALLAVARRWSAARPGALVFAAPAVAADGRWALAPAFTPELAARFGYSNAPVGADGVIRRIAPVLPAADGGVLPSFAVAVLTGYAGTPAAELARALGPDGPGSLALPVRDARTGALRAEPVALARLAEPVWRIDYAGPPGSFTTFPSGPLAALARGGAVPDADNPFRDRIVLVGATFQESRDVFPTPTGLMAGVEIHANAIHTLLGRRALLPPHWLLNLALLAAVCVAVSLLALWLRPVWVAVAGLGLVAALAVVSYEAYARGGYWLDFVAPLAAMLAYLQGAALVGRRRVRAAFGQFVSPEVLARVLREGTTLGGEVRVVSVLMSDLRGFTTLSERLAPDVVTATLNEYFTAMVDVILASRGMVSDFIGDGILAVFGAPLDDPEHAGNAVAAALGMQAALARLNERWAGEGRAALAMGVAVNTGEAFVGNVGSPRKKKYAVIGDTVNTASRIEGLNREFGTGILVSAATLAAVGDRVSARPRGTVTVKGRAAPVEIFEVLGSS
jgi:adenylate cyclase